MLGYWLVFVAGMESSRDRNLVLKRGVNAPPCGYPCSAMKSASIRGDSASVRNIMDMGPVWGRSQK